MNMNPPEDAPPTPRVRLLLIRHSESIQNVNSDNVYNAWRGATQEYRIPSWGEWASLGQTLMANPDTDLSVDGLHMITEQNRRLDAIHFLKTNHVDLVLHSPLIRAKKTCEGLFPESSRPEGLPVKQHDNIYEQCFSEHLGLYDIHTRVRMFLQELLQYPPDIKTVVIVAHGGFFRSLLGVTENMNNCEVRSCVLMSDASVTENTLVLEGGRALLIQPEAN